MADTKPTKYLEYNITLLIKTGAQTFPVVLRHVLTYIFREPKKKTRKARRRTPASHVSQPNCKLSLTVFPPITLAHHIVMAPKLKDLAKKKKRVGPKKKCNGPEMRWRVDLLIGTPPYTEAKHLTNYCDLNYITCH